jgi:hypothetical protein
LQLTKTPYFTCYYEIMCCFSISFIHRLKDEKRRTCEGCETVQLSRSDCSLVCLKIESIATNRSYGNAIPLFDLSHFAELKDSVIPSERKTPAKRCRCPNQFRRKMA